MPPSFKHLIQLKLCVLEERLSFFSPVHSSGFFVCLFVSLLHSILLVSSPTMPQLGTLLSTPQSTQAQPGTHLSTPRTASHTTSSALPQVRVVTAQSSLPPLSQPAQVVAQQQPSLASIPQIRVPSTSVQSKVFSQVSDMCE